MNSEKMQKIYKIIMLVVIVATVTFILTTLFIYQYTGNNIKYISVSSDDGGLANALASFRRIVNQKFLGEIDEEKVMEETIRGYIKGLNDPYTEYITKDEMQQFTADVMGNFSGIGVYITKDTEKNAVTVISSIKDTPAYRAGILPGDIIAKIDGVSYTGEQFEEASNKIKGPIGTKVVLEILRDDQIINLEIVRENIKINHVESEILEKNIGYIVFNTFDSGCADEFKEQFEKLKDKHITSLIIDIRNNGGGLVDEALKIADYIIEKDKTLLITVDKNQNEEISKTKKEAIVDMPIILLVNGHSASASEILAGAIKDNGKATLVGETTYGKGVIQEFLTLRDGSGLKITTNEYYTPNHNKINKVGIKPDVEIKLNKESKEDNQLQKAIEILKQK